MKDIELLLFDLGGVVVDFCGVRAIKPLLKNPLSNAEITQLWSQCALVQQLETGLMEPEEFGDQFVQKWQLSISPSVFLTAFQSWTLGFYPGAKELLTELSSRYRIACLSNSNVLHWRENLQIHGVQSVFEKALASHEMGLHKPDIRIYQSALAELGVRQNQVLFFDDNLANVESARSSGIQSYHTIGFQNLADQIEKLAL